MNVKEKLTTLSAENIVNGFTELFVLEYGETKTKDIYDKWMNSYNTFNETFTCFTKNQKEGIKLSVGVGGIHNIVKNEMYEANEIKY